MGCTSQHLLDVFRKAVEEGWLYVFGASGYPLTRSQIQALQDRYGSDCVWDSDLDKGDTGIPCCDCSGGIDYATGEDNNSTGYHENGGQDVDPWDGQPGWALWMPGHIGVCIGDGRYVAMDGSARNAYVGSISDNGWVAAFPLAEVDYSGGCSWDGSSPEPFDRGDGFTAGGVEYEVATSDGWQGTVTRCDDTDEGFAGDQEKGIKAVRARNLDGKPITLKAEMTDGAVYDATTFTDSLRGDNSDDDGYCGDLDGSTFIAKLWAVGCNGRGAVAGKAWYPPLIEGHTSDGDDYIGDDGKALTALQMWS